MQKIARELEVFLDVVSLRAGQYWERELWTAIPQHDVFYLFWSQAASQSEWVRKEWQCALKTRGLDFIDPVPLASPDDVPPPPELAEKHFNDWVLAFMRGGRGGQPRTHGTAGTPEKQAHAEAGPDAPFGPDGRLAEGSLTATAAGVLQRACIAAGYAGSEAGIAHLALALLQTPAAGLWGAALAQQGFDPEQVREQLRGAAAPVTPGPELPVESRACTPALRGLLAYAHRAATAGGAPPAGERHLVLGLLAQRDDPLVGQFARAGLDLARVEAALGSHPLFDADGRVLAVRLSPAARQALEESAGAALRTGYAMIGTPHLLAGLLFVPGSRLRSALDRLGVSAQRVLDALAAALGGTGPRSRTGLDFVQSAFSLRALEILRLAHEAGDRTGSSVVGEEHLLQGFVAGVDGITRSALERCGATPSLLAQALSGASPAQAAPAGSGATADQALRMDVPPAVEPASDVFLPDGTLNRPLFAESALRALAGAEAAARQLNHAVIGSPHLLVGLMLVPEGAACATLQAQGLTPDLVQRAMFAAFPAGAQPAPREARLVREGCSANLRQILALAREVAREHGAAQIEEPMLLEAFMLDGGGQAGRVLRRLGFGGPAPASGARSPRP
jgi:ATP-dependent Clp protease ATP-binding subunit ClpA